jgi:hypothetical protein
MKSPFSHYLPNISQSCHSLSLFFINKMHFSLLLASVAALATASPVERATKPPAFYLAGDSTTAAPSGSGGGWGNGFLGTLVSGAIGTNYGHNGATTATFVSGGDWATVIAAVKSAKASYTPYVTIQVYFPSHLDGDVGPSALGSKALKDRGLTEISSDTTTKRSSPWLISLQT